MNGFIQNDYERMLFSSAVPMPSEELANVVRRNTIVGIDRVFLEKLLPGGSGDMWIFDVPESSELLVSRLFELSLSSTVVECQMGRFIWDPSGGTMPVVADVFYLRDSDDGSTNIDDRVVEAMADRYAPMGVDRPSPNLV